MLGTIFYGQGMFKFFVIAIPQLEDYNIDIHADDKVRACEAFPIDIMRRKQVDEPLNKIEILHISE